MHATRRKFTDNELLLVLILAVGAALRLWHLSWSLPDMYEEAYPFAVAWKFWHWGEPGITFNPDFFHYPALTFYLQFALQALQYAVGHLVGAYSDLAAFQNSYVRDPTLFILLARGLSVAFDLGSTVLVYAGMSRWFGAKAGLIAAFLLALSPLFITEAQLVNVDTPTAFFALLAFFCMTRASEGAGLRWTFLSGVAIGLATASKYTGALLIVPLAVMELRRATGARSVGALLLAGAAAAAVFFLLNPYILLHRSQFLADFSYEQRHMATGHLGVDATQNSLLWYLTDAFPRLLGWPLLLAVGVGVWLGALAKDDRLLLTGLFPLTLLAVMGTWEMRADRYLLPLLPFVLMIGAYGAAGLSARGGAIVSAWISERAGAARAARTGLLVLLLAALVVSPLDAVLSYHRSRELPDTRTEAKDWIVRSFPAHATVVTGPFGIRLAEERFTMLLIPFSPTGSEALAPFYAPAWYEDFDLLIASDYDYGRFALEPERYKEILAQYGRLRATWHLAAEFHPRQDQNGPTLWLYRPPGHSPPLFDASLFGPLSLVAETTLVVNFAENLASTLFDRGSPQKALQMSEVALALAPTHTRLVNSFAWALFKKGKLQEALAVTERSLALDPSQAEIVGLHGSILLRTGNEAQAETELLRAVGLNARQEIPYLDLELLYRNRNDRAKQIDILRRYLAILPPGSENARRTESYLRQISGR